MVLQSISVGEPEMASVVEGARHSTYYEEEKDEATLVDQYGHIMPV